MSACCHPEHLEARGGGWLQLHTITTTPPRERRLLANLYNGNVYLWNYNDSVRLCVYCATDMHVHDTACPQDSSWHSYRLKQQQSLQHIVDMSALLLQTLVKSFEVTELPGVYPVWLLPSLPAMRLTAQ